MFDEKVTTEDKDKSKRKYQDFPPKKKMVGKVIVILPTRIVVDYKGNGVSIDFDAKIHAGLKVGDEIEII